MDEGGLKGIVLEAVKDETQTKGEKEE